MYRCVNPLLWCVKTLKISKFPSVGLYAVGYKDFDILKVPQCWDIVVIVLWYVDTFKIPKFLVYGFHTEKIGYF